MNANCFAVVSLNKGRIRPLNYTVTKILSEVYLEFTYVNTLIFFIVSTVLNIIIFSANFNSSRDV